MDSKENNVGVAIDNRINNVGKSFVKFVSLNILSMLAMSFYVIADTVFIANGVGNRGLTALNIVLPFYSLLNGTGVLLGIGGATRYSIERGRGDNKVAERIFTEVMIVGASLGTLYMVLGLSIPREICTMLGADESVIDYAVTYLRALSIFNLPFTVNHIILAFVRNDNAPRLGMAAVVTSSLFNIFFDWLLMYPCDLGIFGASFATGFSSVVSIAVLSAHFIRRKNNFRFVKPRFYWADFKVILPSGFPSMVAEMSSGIVILVLNQLLYANGGNVAINAYSVVANLAIVAMFTLNGVSQGVQPLFSYNYGAEKWKNIDKILLYGVLTALGVAIVYFSLFWGMDNLLIRLFNKENDPSMTVLAKEAIRLYDICYFGAALNIAATAFFATCGRPIFSFIISTLRGLILPIAFSFPMSMLWQLKGIWLIMTAAEYVTLCVTVILLTITCVKMRRRRKCQG